ncbi:hypothetical protein ACLOJK_040895 [Asimina triloba]
MSSTFSALIAGRCKRQNSERAYQLFKIMNKLGCHPNANTFTMLVSSFRKNEDFEGAGKILMEMLERSMALDSVMLSELFEGLCRYGKVSIVITLCKEMQARNLMPVCFDKVRIIAKQYDC